MAPQTEKIEILIEAINKASSEFAKIKGDLEGLQRVSKTTAERFQQFGTSLQKTGKSMSSMGVGMTAGITLPLLLLGKTAASVAIDFEQSMTNSFVAFGDITAETEEQLTSFNRKLGRDTAFSAKQAADATFNLATAGFTASEAMDLLPGNLDAAAALQADLARVTEQSSIAMKTFGIHSSDASRITDTFVAAQNNSLVTFSRLEDSLKFAAPTFSAVGQSLEETIAALEAFAEVGFVGEQGGTAIRNVMVRLLSPTNEAKRAIEGLGLTMEQVNPETNDFADILQTFQDAGLDAARAVEIFGSRAGPSLIAVLKKARREGEDISDVFAEFESHLGATGAAAIAADKQLDTLGGRLLILKSSIDEVFISFLADTGVQEMLKGLVEGLTEFANKISSLSSETKVIVLQMLGFAAALGPILLITGKLVSIVGGLITFFSSLSPAVLAVVGPVAIVAASLAAFIAILTTTEEGRKALTAGFNILKDLWMAVQPILSALAGVLVSVLLPIFTILAETVIPIFASVLESISPVIEVLAGLFSSMSSVLEFFTNIISSFLIGAVEGLTGVFKFLEPVLALMGLGFAVIQVALNAVGVALQPVIDWVKALKERFMEFVEGNPMLLEAFTAIGEVVDAIAGALSTFLTTINELTEAYRELNEIQDANRERYAEGAKELAVLDEAMTNTTGVQQEFIERTRQLTELSLEQSKAMAEGRTEDMQEINKAFNENASEMKDWVAKSGVRYEDIADKAGIFGEEATLALTSVDVGLAVNIKSANKAAKDVSGSLQDMEQSFDKTGKAGEQGLGQVSTAATDVSQDVTKAGKKTVDDYLGEMDRLAPEAGAATQEMADVISTNAQAPAEQASLWGAHFVQNFTAGMASQMPSLRAQVGEIKTALEAVAFSTNPDIPSEIWGFDFSENFGGGIAKGTQQVITPAVDGIVNELEVLSMASEEVFTSITREFKRGAEDTSVSFKKLTKGMTDFTDITEIFNDVMKDSLENLKDSEDQAEDLADVYGDLREAMADLDQEFLKLSADGNEFRASLTDIDNLLNDVEVDQVVSSYDDLQDVLSDVKSEIEDLKDTHNDFISDAQQGLDDFESKVEEIREKFASFADDISQKGADEASKSFVKAMQEREKLEEQILRAQTGVDAVEGDPKQRQKAQEKLDDLKAQLQEVQALEAEFSALRSEVGLYESQIAQLKTEIDGLEIGTEKRIALEDQLKDTLLDQKVAQDILAASDRARQEEELKNSLSSLEFNRLKTKEALQQNAELQDQAIKTAQEIQRVQEAIVSGTIKELDVAGLGEEARTLAGEAVAELDTFQANIDAQIGILKQAKEIEVQLFKDSRNEMVRLQVEFQQSLELSYDQIILKLEEVARASEKALRAQMAVAGTSRQTGGVSQGFASGGFTSNIGVNKVAGVVHGGEWVAPNWMVKSLRPMFSQLENMRRNKIQGFQEGGEVGGGSITNVPITMNNTVSNDMDFNTIGRNIAWIISTAG